MTKYLDLAARCAALTLAALLLPGCRSAAPAETPAAKKTIRTALLADDGSRGSGALYWARMLANSPELEFELVDGADIRNGKLENIDLLVVPGGSSFRQYDRLGEAGLEAIRRFVARGGAYVGSCAGMHLALNQDKRGRLLAYRRVKDAYGAEAPLSVNISGSGAKRLGIAPGMRVVRYSHGPIVAPEPLAGGEKCEVIASYSSFITSLGKETRSFFGTPAALYGEYGKGRIVVSSFHPESYAASRDIALGMIFGATGTTPKPVYPVKEFRPVRVGYFSPTILGKRSFNEVLELDREAGIDLRLTDTMDMDQGALEHLDVMIFAHGNETRGRRLMTRQRNEAVTEFMRRGGTVIVSGNAASYLPEHPNRVVIPLESPLLPTVKAACRAPSRNPPEVSRP